MVDVVVAVVVARLETHQPTFVGVDHSTLNLHSILHSAFCTS